MLVIDFSDNPIGPDGGHSVAEGLKDAMVLRELNLDGCGLQDDGVRAIAESLRTRNRVLQRLHLQRNGTLEVGWLVGLLVGW